jgi:hypothetical protein
MAERLLKAPERCERSDPTSDPPHRRKRRVPTRVVVTSEVLIVDAEGNERPFDPAEL